MLLNPRSAASVKTEYGYASFFASQVGTGAAFRGVVASGHRSCPQESRVIGYLKLMAREFKPVRFFVMMAVAAFIVFGVTAFYTHRAEHGRTAEERQAYRIGEKSGRASAARRKIGHARGIEHDGPEVFREARIG